jgi:hypothetical protein
LENFTVPELSDLESLAKIKDILKAAQQRQQDRIEGCQVRILRLNRIIKLQVESEI